MNQMNQIILEGRLTKEPEQRTFGDDGVRKGARLSLAVNRYYKNKDGEKEQETSYFDVEAYGPLAEKAAGAEKGKKIRVTGHAYQRTWKDESGKTHSRIVVLADAIDFERPGLLIGNLNQIILEGNLSEDTRQKAEGKKPAKFSIATNRSWEGNDGEWKNKATFIDVDAFGKEGEFASGLQKGQTVRVVGRLKQDRWIDGEGKNQAKISITAEHVEKKREISHKKDEPEVGR